MSMDNNEIEKRLIALEERYSYQENLINELNEVITKQEFVIDELIRHVNNLIAGANAESSAEKLTLDNLKDYRPPHY